MNRIASLTNCLRAICMVSTMVYTVISCYSQSSEDLIVRSEKAMDNRDWVIAIDSYNELLNSSSSSITLSRQQLSQVLLNQGIAYLNNREFVKAEEQLLKSLEIKKELEDFHSNTYGLVLEQLGFVYIRTGQYDKAKSYITTAIEIVEKEKGKNSLEYAQAISELGEFYEKVGYYPEAFENFSKAHDIIELLHDENTPEYANICGHLGRILIKNGMLSQAERYLQQATDVYKTLGDTYITDYTSSLESLGVLYESEGKFAESEKILLQNLEIKKSIEGLPDENLIETLNDLGILYQHLGNLDKSEQYFSEVYDICIESLGKDHGYYGIATNNLGTIAKKKGEFERAEKLLIESIRVYENTYGANHPLYADALNNLASVEVSLKKYEEADQRYQQVLGIDRALYGTKHPLYATALSNYGILLFKKGEISKAEDFYKEALMIREEVLGINHPSYAKSLENLGLYYFVDGKLDEAEQYLREAVDILKDQLSTLFPVMTERERELFYQTIRDDIERYNYVALQMIEDKPELIEVILNNQIQTKAILMNSSDRAKTQIRKNTSPEIIKLYNQWVSEKDKLIRYYQLGRARLAENNIQLSEIEQGVESLEKELLSKSNEFADIVPTTTKTWEDIQKALNKDEAVVEILKVRKFNTQQTDEETGFGFMENCSYIAIVFNKDSEYPELVELEEGINLETIHYPYYSNALEYNLDDDDSYKFFWKPIDKVLDKPTNVYVSPDGIFHKINPNVFKLSSKEYLIDDYYVSYVTNCTDLLKEKLKDAPLKRAYLVGNPEFNYKEYPNFIKPLPGAQREVNNIKTYFEGKSSWDARVYTGKEASESRIKGFFQPTIIHIATHGFFMDGDRISSRMIGEDANPMFQSGLYLSGIEDAYNNFQRGYRNDPNNDGMLTAYEVVNMNLEMTDVVILSACETGLGLINNGEGVYGLQRAFMVAGAKSLILSSVKVDDEATERLMTYFYDNYAKNKSIKDSLKDAQLSLREDYPSPYIWGSFILIGKG